MSHPDPDLMTLWWAPAGTPVPASVDEPLHPDFRPAGQVDRNLSAANAGMGVTYDLARGEELVPAVRLMLRWPYDDWRDLPWRRGVFVSLVFDADGQGRGVAPRVELGSFTPDPYEGGRMDVVAHLAGSAAGCVCWFRPVPATAAP